MSELELDKFAIQDYIRKIKYLEECKKEWLELKETLIIENFDLEIKRCKLYLMMLRGVGGKGNIDFLYKILLKLKNNCIQKQENLETLTEIDYIDDGTYLMECNRNKKINDEINMYFQEYERRKSLLHA